MKLILLGATGQVGSHVLQAALQRGHTVTAVARYTDPLPRSPALTVQQADVTAYAGLPALVAGHDVVIGAVPFRTYAAAPFLAAVAAGRPGRLVMVGGAGSLEVAPGQALVATPDFPEEYRPEALAGREVLRNLVAGYALPWTFLSPSAHLHAGPRIGTFRLGQDTLLVDAHGESHISLSDYATALLDEVERPQHVNRRFTVGY